MMSSISETEQRRSRWKRHLAVEGVDDISRPDFARGGLGSRLDSMLARMFLLPEDPDTDSWEFDEAFWAQLAEHKSVDLDDGTIHLGHEIIPTAHAAALTYRHGYHTEWLRYAAIHHSGMVEVGLGERRHHHAAGGDSEGRAYVDLVRIVGFTWALAELARHLGSPEATGPYLLTVALPDTRGAFLTGLGEGYVYPGQFNYNIKPCPDEHLLWNIELEDLPADIAESQRLAFRVGSRIENAWGLRQQAYLDLKGSNEGQLNIQLAGR